MLMRIAEERQGCAGCARTSSWAQPSAIFPPFTDELHELAVAGSGSSGHPEN
jgi:hypothetical protein